MTTPQMNMRNIRFAFFGTSHIAAMVLEELEKAGLLPAHIVTLPPKRQGRGMQEVGTDVAAWAKQKNIPLAYDWSDFESAPPAGGWDVAIVVDYGKILPQSLLSIPKKGFLNMHPSLLPRLRGASPMRSAILNNERDTGVSVIRIDEEMDHGPIVAQKRAQLSEWPLKNSELENILIPLGGALLAQILPEYVAGNIEPVQQNHDVATYSGKFSKEDGLLDLKGDVLANLRKIYAFEGWPGTYAFFERAGKKIRVAILDAHIEGRALVLDTVKPEGKNAMSYEEFARSDAKPL